MRLLDRYLVTLIAMLGVAAGLAYTPLRTSSWTAAGPLPSFPGRVGEWVGSSGAPSDILPVDPRAKENGRWTYRKDNQVVWLAVSLYDSRNDPQSRPSINYILPERSAGGIERTIVSLNLNGVAEHGTSVNQIVVTMATSRLEMLYWYQLGPKPIAAESRFRFVSFINTFLGKDERVALVRVATTTAATGRAVPNPDTLERFLQAFHPFLTKALAGEESREQSAVSDQWPGFGSQPKT